MAPKDKTVTLQSVDICSALLARLDTQRERYKNMRKKKDTASRLLCAQKIKLQTLLGTYHQSSVIRKQCVVSARCPFNKNRITALSISLNKSFKV